MKVVFTIAGLHPESGGPARSVPALCEGLGRKAVDVEIISLDYGRNARKPLTPDERLVKTIYVSCSTPLARRMQWTAEFKSTLRTRCRAAKFQVIHDTGLWLPANHAAAAVSRELKLPRIVSPRGMLSDWALRHNGWKKRIAWACYQHRDLKSAEVLHATSDAEAQEFRLAGLRQPVAVIPNGVDLPAQKSEVGSRKSEARTVLFLSRIHPKKGLLNLVDAWARIRPRGWRMVIAGTDEEGHLEEVKAEVRRYNLEDIFEFVGAVEGEARWNLYRSADLFVLPSHSENFGLVVAEALACGVPVITTHATPWEEVITHQCGWWIDNRPETLANALRDAMCHSDDERRAMGLRGRKLVDKKYSWPGIAVQMRSVYQWMLAGGSTPDCVVT